MFAVDVPITKGYTCILHHGSVQATASVKKLRGLLDKHHRRSCSKHQETSFIDQRKQCSGRDCHRDPSVLGLVRQLQGVGQVHVTHWRKDHRCWNGCRHMMQPNRLKYYSIQQYSWAKPMNDRGHTYSMYSTLVPCCHSPMLLENGAVISLQGRQFLSSRCCILQDNALSSPSYYSTIVATIVV